ncbi:MAG: hypothetical protein H7Z19_17540, partial [Chitinophagaceae bacterium]|nr:hypothetical protein [Rubrivivax sp.]
MNPPHFTLRRACARDAADFAGLMANPDVYANLMQLPLPSEAMWRARLETQDAAGPIGAGDLHVVAERDGRVIGSAGLHPVDRLRR